MNLVAVDLSHWNEVQSFVAMEGAGVVGVILKATEGTSYVDDTYYKRRDAAYDADLRVATYHFLKHGSVDQQMQHYLDTVAPAYGERMCIDYEDAACTLDDLRQAVQYLQADERCLQVTVYSGHLIKEQLGDTLDPLLSTTSLWLAQYTTGTPTWPKATWPVWSLWQYTDKATVPGCTGLVDGNYFNGSSESCAEWFGPLAEPGPKPEPSPDIEPGTVLMDITVADDVYIEITVNGMVLVRGKNR